MGIIPRTKTT